MTTNSDKIVKKAREIFGDVYVDYKLKSGEDIPFHTEKVWNKMGYKIIPDSIPYKIVIWKKKKGEEAYFKRTSLFYTNDQVNKE